MKKILILASNPRRDLDLDDEIRLLRSVINQSRNRDQFDVVSEPGVRVGDLQGLLLQHEPQIVHFCGHGDVEEGLIFKIDGGGEQRLQADALANTFGLNPICSHVECVVLNACYTDKEADAIVRSINYVVGMRQTIQDNAAIAFSKGFYLGLGYGCSIEDSFEFGKNAIQLEISGSSVVRSAVSEAQRKGEVINVVTNTLIPEHSKPILRKKKKTNLDENSNIPSSNLKLSEEKRAEIQLDIEKTLEIDIKVKQYREKVKEFLSVRKLEDYEKVFLNRLRDELGLSFEKADQILEEELAPILQAQQSYETLLNDLVKFYPFSDAIESQLKNFQAERNLTDEEVAEIARPILEQAEIDYQEKLRQQAQQAHKNKRQRYEQEFIRAIKAGYPIEDSLRNGLRSFQQSLELSDEDIEQIEQPLIAPKEAEYQQKLAEVQRQKEQEEKTREEALKQRQREEAQRKREQEESAKREQQRQEKERLERMKTKLPLKLQSFEFDVITVDKKGKENSRTRKSAEFFAEDLGNGILLEMVMIPRGTYLMGSPEGKGVGTQRPQHSVTVPSFFMGKYSITQAQWRAVAALPQVEIPLNPDPSHFKGKSRPVEQVCWHEAVEFCQRLSRFTANQYRLPSEAEWEYACRAGTTTEFYFGDTLTPKLARCKANLGMAIVTMFGGETAPVGSYLPNAFGLYDMHGNVSEWCADHWHASYDGAPKDGSAWLTGGDSESRVRRGGSWNIYPAACRSASRYYDDPANRDNTIGFRVVVAVLPGLF